MPYVKIYQENYLDVDIYPNPSTDNITIMTSRKFNGLIQVYSSDGKIQLESEIMFDRNVNFDVSNLKNGIYILSLKGFGMKSFVTRYFIVAK